VMNGERRIVDWLLSRIFKGENRLGELVEHGWSCSANNLFPTGRFQNLG